MHLYTLEDRQKNYQNIRDRIFSSELKTEKITMPRRIKKVREKFAEKKRKWKFIIEAVKSADRKSFDPRPYAEIKIGNVRVNGLLDTGSSVSILGKGCRELIVELDVTI